MIDFQIQLGYSNIKMVVSCISSVDYSCSFLTLFLISLQLLLFLKGFTESERNKLAMLTGILLANGNISGLILSSLFNENLVKEGKV